MIVSVLYLVYSNIFASPRNFLHISNLVSFIPVQEDTSYTCTSLGIDF